MGSRDGFRAASRMEPTDSGDLRHGDALVLRRAYRDSTFSRMGEKII